MALILAAVLVALFVANVTLGSLDGQPPLGNVAELLLLIGAAVAFAVAVLRAEARARGTAAPRARSERDPSGTPPAA